MSNKIWGTFEKFYNIFLVSLTLIVTILGMYQVLARYLLGWSISWTEETMRYLHVAIIMLGIAAVSKSKAFTTISILTDYSDRYPIIGKLLRLFQNLIQIIFFALIFYYGAKLSRQAVKQLASTTRISFAIVYLPLPIGGLMGLFYAIKGFVEEAISKPSEKVGGTNGI
ncbi:MAG TPA: hypothetical protein DIC53_11075 [Synergistaceae bacterium]|jgi:TRAP-type C4-dicarboxylate transport system permease small subunit|nr:hypothetical protein [Synergistaceae bacterium]